MDAKLSATVAAAPGCINPDAFYSYDSFCDTLRLPERTRTELLRSLRADNSDKFIEHSRECQYLFGNHGIKHLAAVSEILLSLRNSQRQRMNSVRKKKRKKK